MKLHNMYKPVTAAPFQCTANYMEFEPCDALKPYIRCFWGSQRAVLYENTSNIVIPDTCMDIIFTADFTNNRVESCFCGIDDRTFITHTHHKEKKLLFRFAIRFYAWGVPMFSKNSMRNTKNTFFDAEYHFPTIKREIEKQIYDFADICLFIPIVEKILLNHFHEKYQNPAVLQTMFQILKNKGNISMDDLRQDTFVSSRQLERLFLEYIGVSPKSLASMVRYQFLWNEFLYHREFNFSDAVYKYGYFDQAHLCHEFKKYHSMNLSDAKKYALQNVGNIQDESLKQEYN